MYGKADVRAMRDMTAALRELADLLRDLHGLPAGTASGELPHRPDQRHRPRHHLGRNLRCHGHDYPSRGLGRHRTGGRDVAAGRPRR